MTIHTANGLNFYKLAAFTSGIQTVLNINNRNPIGRMYAKDRDSFKGDFVKSQMYRAFLSVKHAHVSTTVLL
ncbi:MAG: hypothetical protein MK132_00230 [Lentisphaerales bacterium]|nr:hypothetical protein [Lentisphaerales bacterium]